MKGKGLKQRFMGTFLSCVLALSAVVGTPMTANAEGVTAADKEVLTGTEWWQGSQTGSNKTMSGDGTWTWEVHASALVNGYGAFNVEIVDPNVNGFITTGSDKNAWTAEGFDPVKATISGIPDETERGSSLVEGHTYAVTVTRSGNAFTVRYLDHTTGSEICTLGITLGETVGTEVVTHVIAQVGTYATAFYEGASIPEPDDPGTDDPGTDDPGTDDPGTDDPGTDDPGTDDPGTDDPGNIFLECGGFRSTHTNGFEITPEVFTYAFHSTTNSNALNNWDTPVFVVFHSEDSKVNGGGYKEYAVLRSDNFALDGGVAIKTSEAFPEGFDWAAWQAANRAGVDCAVTTQLYNGYALIGVTNNGITTTYVVPVDSSVKNYVSLSGENCVLSNGQPSTQHIDLSAAKAKADEMTSTPTNVFLDCGDFWTAHTDGFAITEQLQSYAFHSQTYGNALNNWETPLYVIFHSSDAKVNGENYREYGVLRSDNWFWDGAGMEFPMIQATYALPEDWAAWQESNRAGADCIVSTQLYNGCALIGISNNGVTNTYAIRIDPTVTNYLSLTGEHCTLSNLQPTDQHINLGEAQVYADVLAGYSHNPYIPAAAPTGEVKTVEGGEVLAGSAWWTGMAIGSNQPMSGDGTWTWMVQASSLIDGYGAFSVEIYDPATNGYITTGSDKNAWTAEGFDPTRASVSGVAAELASNLVEGHTYAVMVTRSGNTFTIRYVDYTDGTEVCTLTVTPGETVGNDVMT
ncbi:MAG: hypothetical protein K2O34_03400, partial [Acetatifactor sp.]|nr:hypothetical protein [Acetatifactor sp.]